MPQDDLSAVSTVTPVEKPLRRAAMRGGDVNLRPSDPDFPPVSIPAGAFVTPGNRELLALHRAFEDFGRAFFRLQRFNATLHQLNTQADAVLAQPAKAARSGLAAACRNTWLNAKLIAAARRIGDEEARYLRALGRVAEAFAPVLRSPAAPHYIPAARVFFPHLNPEQRAALSAACPQLNSPTPPQS